VSHKAIWPVLHDSLLALNTNIYGKKPSEVPYRPQPKNNTCNNEQIRYHCDP
jgi:hypothetical protein